MKRLSFWILFLVGILVLGVNMWATKRVKEAPKVDMLPKSALIQKSMYKKPEKVMQKQEMIKKRMPPKQLTSSPVQTSDGSDPDVTKGKVMQERINDVHLLM